MKLSIVSTLFKSSAYLNEFYKRVSLAANVIAGDDYEIVLVNDGCPDNSLDIAIEISNQDSHVVVVDLSRNFGHHKAIMTGLKNTHADNIFLIDSDLEEDPEWLLTFWQRMELESCDVVYGVQERRRGGWFERWSGSIFYSAMRSLSGLPLQKNIVTARLMTRRYVNALLEHHEREVFLAGLWHITGFAQEQQVVQKKSSSETTYSFRKKLSLFVTSITSFSNRPLVFIFYLGLFISAFAITYVIYLAIQRVFFLQSVDGWTTVVASIWLIGGVNISFVGIIGLYISKIYLEIKQRPYTIIRKIYGKR